jgi:tRNA threonylcarbamoyladenosine biosynthesis protein TsaB
VYILNIETATKNCSVSLAKNGQTIFCKEIAEIGYSHAEKLHLFIEEVLAETNNTFSDLSAIAVSKGPGSYTGLRIGVSAAKGLCFGLDIPLISVDTLAILAQQLKINDGFIVPMIDARRMEVYSAIFNKSYVKTREVRAEILNDESFNTIDEKVHLIGDCSVKAKTVLTKNNFIFHDQIVYPSANEMSKLSFEKFKNNDFENVAYFEPYYLKDFMLTIK